MAGWRSEDVRRLLELLGLSVVLTALGLAAAFEAAACVIPAGVANVGL